jgi:NAD/NADP transhydrogenase beta subunit
MKLKTFLIFNAAVLGISALTCLLFPNKVLALYGVESNPASSFMGLYGALGSIAIVTVTWFTRNIEDQKAQRAIILALLITFVIGVIISISGIISGVMTKGWPVVGIYLFFALGYAYFLFFKRK